MDNLSVVHHERNAATIKFGVHVMIDGYYATGSTMTNKDDFLALLKILPLELGMHTICEPVVVEVGPNCVKDPGGLSGFVMIAESHISFHSFPARGFVTIDLYTCQNDIDRESICSRLVDAFGIRDADIYVQERGQRYPAVDLMLPAHE